MTVALVARRLHVIIIWLWFPDKFHIGLVYLDNVIFHGRLSDRNYWCRRRRRYLIFSQFSIYCYQNAFASGALPRTPPGGVQLPHLANVGSHHCRGPHRIAGPRAPRPHDPPLNVRESAKNRTTHILFSPCWHITYVYLYYCGIIDSVQWNLTNMVTHRTWQKWPE